MGRKESNQTNKQKNIDVIFDLGHLTKMATMLIYGKTKYVYIISLSFI